MSEAIKELFDDMDRELLMKAVLKHTDETWVILYIERWLKALLQLDDGTIRKNGSRSVSWRGC